VRVGLQVEAKLSRCFVLRRGRVVVPVLPAKSLKALGFGISGSFGSFGSDGGPRLIGRRSGPALASPASP
jgi:hypothetical protein